MTEPTMDDLRSVAERVSNWGRWGDDDQLGTLNLITPERIALAAQLVVSGRTFSLSIDLDSTGPQTGGGRINPIRLMSSINQDLLGPVRYSDDYVVMPLQAGTQWDAIAHVGYDGYYYNGRPDTCVTAAGTSFAGIENIARSGGIIGRGVLLDVAAARGAPYLEPREVIQPEDLVAVAEAQGVELREGDVLVIRTGWRRRFVEAGHDGWALDSPGLGWRSAEWMHDVGIAAVACDNIAVEVIISEIPDVALPFHMLALRDMGMPLGELWDLEELATDCASDQVYEFMLVAPALRFTNGLGTPVNPVAIK